MIDFGLLLAVPSYEEQVPGLSLRGKRLLESGYVIGSSRRRRDSAHLKNTPGDAFQLDKPASKPIY